MKEIATTLAGRKKSVIMIWETNGLFEERHDVYSNSFMNLSKFRQHSTYAGVCHSSHCERWTQYCELSSESQYISVNLS